MKKYVNTLSKMLMIVMATFITIIANAETIPTTLTMTHYAKTNVPVDFPATFYVKKTTSGKYVYCNEYAKKI